MIKSGAGLFFLAFLATVSSRPLWGQESVDPRGQYPDVGTGNVAPSPSGTLELLIEPGDLRGGSRQVQDARRSRIRIYDEAGRFVREVVAVSPVEGRMAFDLAPGKYLVEVASPSGRKTFRATVAPEHWTVVNPARAGEHETRTPPPVEP